MAKASPVDPSNPAPDGFPSLVLKALKQSLSTQESSGSKVVAPPSGWNQRNVITDALPILQELLKSGAEAAISQQLPPVTTAQTQPNPSSKLTSTSLYQLPSPPPSRFFQISRNSRNANSQRLESMKQNRKESKSSTRRRRRRWRRRRK